MRKIDRVKKRFVVDGLDVALNGKKGSRVYKKKADGDFEAHLLALSCSNPPKGFSRWLSTGVMRRRDSSMINWHRVWLPVV